MSIHQIDFIFPFFVLFYGLVVSVVLNIPHLMRLADERFPQQMVQKLKAHRDLALICLLVGSLWSLQNVLISF